MANPNSSAQRFFAAEPYDSVAVVLASKQITAALVGQTIHTKDGHAYQVAAATATDHHVTTAGGAKLYVLPTGRGYEVKSFGAVGDGEANDYAQIVKAKEAAGITGHPICFTKGNYFIGENELVFSETGIVVICDSGVEIRGNGGVDGGYVVSFARSGGAAQPTGTHPTNQRVRGLRVRTVAPFSASEGRAAVRVCGSYNDFTDCSVVTSADNGGNAWMLEADNTGSGPYYNTFTDVNLQGPQNGAATGTGIMMRQKAGTAFATRYPNANTFVGGRVGGYAVNTELTGAGNRIIAPTSENYPGFGTAFKWVSPVASSNVANEVVSPYIENAAIGFEVDASANTPQVIGPYTTGVTTTVSDPSNRLTIFGQDGIRGVRLAKAPNANAARSGIFVGNTANADPETLDWYQEGSWVPTLVGATTAGDYTVTTTTAKYTRVGNMVHVSAVMTITMNSAGSGIARFGGLPFAKGSNVAIRGSATVTNTTIDPNIRDLGVSHWALAADSTFALQGSRSATSQLAINVTDFLAGATVTVDFTYFV